MSAIQMTCTHCKGLFIGGMVGMTPWPEHICPDGTRSAPSVLGWNKEKANEQIDAWEGEGGA